MAKIFLWNIAKEFGDFFGYFLKFFGDFFTKSSGHTDCEIHLNGDGEKVLMKKVLNLNCEDDTEKMLQV